MLLLDVDGVLTDGRIIYTDRGVEVKAFHVRDGSALKIWRLQGKKAGVLTGRTSPAVSIRAAELGLDPVIQGAADKLEALREVLSRTGLSAERICYVGDDVPDLPVLGQCGVAVAVADACPEVRAAADHVTRAPGGAGAVREVVEWLLRSQGRWQAVIEQYRSQTLG